MKYGAKLTEIDGIVFHSKREAARYSYLKMLHLGKEIADLELQPTYTIVIKDKKICNVILDFRYRDLKTGKQIIEDSKGFDTPVSKLKRKLVEAAAGIEVRIV